MTTSVYIHIPFCEHLCSYCDFTKRFYNEEVASKYLDSLEKEILEKYRGEMIKTLYIGGGTPSSLSINNLLKLKKIVEIIKLDSNYEFTFEVNPENIDLDKINILIMMGVNRISMGVESTIPKYLDYLNRKHNFLDVKKKIALFKEKGLKNINVDLIYAIPGESIDDLKTDLDNILSLDITHISTYSLEIHDNTLLGINNIKNISEDLDREMYDYICNYLKKHGFTHYEISNFCRDDCYSKHNVVYWKNEEYYGFGLGASGYVDSIRYQNTKSLDSYIKGKRIIDLEKLVKKNIITYELILGFRLVNGINKKDFKEKYGKELVNQKGINELLKKGYLIDDGLNIKISYDKLYVENSILEYFV